MKNIKLGHQAPKGYKINKFNSIEIEGDFAYCKSHNFLYNEQVEKEKLYNGLPCYFTDIRFIDGDYNFYKNTHLHWKRFKDSSLKSYIRKTLNCRNIPVGTIVDFKKSWSFIKGDIDNSFKFKIKKENNIDIDYEINNPSYYENFTNCNFSKILTHALRKEGFIVRVEKNESFLGGMLNTAISLTGGEQIDNEIEGDIAVAYGYGKKIGFSSFNNDFMGYSDGEDNILWDNFGEFDKWSRCNHISKKTKISEIINILKQ